MLFFYKSCLLNILWEYYVIKKCYINSNINFNVINFEKLKLKINVIL